VKKKVEFVFDERGLIEIEPCAFCGRKPTIGFPYDGDVNWVHLCNPGNPNGERWMKESVNLETFEAALADWEAFNQETRRLTNRW